MLVYSLILLHQWCVWSYVIVQTPARDKPQLSTSDGY
jgi:hypothetical protein